MKKSLIKIISCLMVLTILCSCDGTSVIRQGKITNVISQSSVIRKTKIKTKDEFEIFFNNFEESFIIPGLKEGIIPQGICYDETTDCFLITGYYDKEKFPSMIMAVNASTGELIGAYPLKTTNGDDYYGHAGGIAASQNTVYITSDGECYTFPSINIKTTRNGSPITFSGKFKLNTLGSFACINNNILWVGDFIESSSDAREQATNITTLSSGETFYAYCEGYKLSDGLPNTKNINSQSNGYIPDYILAIPEQVQGMAFTKTDKIIFSTSYGRKNNSKLYIFNDVMINEKAGTIKIDGKSVDVIACSTADLEAEITAPPMAEGMAIHPNGIYIIFESGAKKYRNHRGKNPVDTAFTTNIE